jgi:hypothetical protein
VSPYKENAAVKACGMGKLEESDYWFIVSGQQARKYEPFWP